MSLVCPLLSSANPQHMDAEASESPLDRLLCKWIPLVATGPSMQVRELDC
jgi:hypothetical protein